MLEHGFSTHVVTDHEIDGCVVVGSRSST